MTTKTPLLYEDKPLFGLDIGHGKVRVLQLQPTKGLPRLVGYGETTFDTSAIEDGVITEPEKVAAAIQELFKHNLVGDITTHRVAVALPSARAFTRSIEVPKLSDKELAEAVQNEAEQYIPAAVDDLYIDYTKVGISDDDCSAFIVAVPRAIVDSYVTLTRLLGLEAVVFQTSSDASTHLFARDSQSDVPTVLVDFGNESADISVYNHGPIVSGTVASGGEQLTQAIAKALGVTPKEAELIKSKYGLSHSKKQAQIETALTPSLNLLIKEIKRTIRYFEEHDHNKQTISQVVIMGGGANMPGLADYLTNSLRVAVRAFDPTSYLTFGHLQPFNSSNRMSFVTAAGLASINPREVFA